MTRDFRFTLVMEIDPPGDFFDTHDRDLGLEGLMIGQRHLENARKAERLGYDCISVGDHLYTSPNALISCMAAASATESVKVGQTVLINDFRHPVQLAKMIASIDVFSNGRAEVGLGTGYNSDEFRQSGVPFDPPRVRIARLRESVAIVKELLTSEEPVHFNGEYYTVDGLVGMPRPVQKPRPAVMIGAGQPMMLKLAGELADVVNIFPGNNYASGLPRNPRSFTMDAFAESVARVKEAAGGRYDDLRTGFLLVKVIATDDPERAVSEVHAEFDGAYRMLHSHEDGFTLSVDELAASPYMCIGTHDQIAQKLRDIRDSLGCSNFLVLYGHADEFAPVINLLKGT